MLLPRMTHTFHTESEYVVCTLCGRVVEESMYGIHLLFCVDARINYLEKKHICTLKEKYQIQSCEKAVECPVCYTTCSTTLRKLSCDHDLCDECFGKWVETCTKNGIKTFCPCCKKEL